MPAGHLHHVLLAGLLGHVGHRRRLATGGQAAFPQFLAVLQVVGAQVVIQGAAHEGHATGSDDRPTQRWRTHRQRDAQGRAVAAGAVLVHPDLLHAAQVQRGDVTPGWRLARQAEHRQEGLQPHHVRRAEVRLQTGLATTGALLRIDVITVDHGRDEGQVVRCAEQQLAARIDSHGRPVKGSHVARIDQRALLRGRREIALVAQLAELDAAHHLVQRRATPHVALAQRLVRRVAHGRIGLRGRGELAVVGALRHGHLVDRHDGLASTPVEDVQVAALGRLDDGRDLALRPVDIHQRGLRRQVAIPEIVVHRLEFPAHLAARQVQRHQGVGEALGFRRARLRPLVRRLVAGGDVDQPQRLVGGGDGPGVRRAAHVGFAGGQGLGGVRIARVEIPYQLAAAHVIGADHPAGGIHRTVVGDRATDDDQLLGHHGRRSRQVDAQRALAQPGLEVHRAGITEVLAGLAVGNVQGDQRAVIGRQEQSALATRSRLGRRGRRLAVGRGVVVGQTAAGHVLVVLGIAIDARIEAPALLAGVGIHRDGDAVRGADEQVVADLQRCDLIGDLTRVALARQIAGVELPGLLQLADIGRCDQVRRCVAVAPVGAAIGRPLAGPASGLTFRGQALHLRVAELTGDRVVVLRQ